MQKAVLHDGILQGMPRRATTARWSERHQKLHQIGQWCRSKSIEQLRCVCVVQSLLHAKSIRFGSWHHFPIFTQIHTHKTTTTKNTPKDFYRWCWRRRRWSTMDKWLKIRDNKSIKIQNTYTKPREKRQSDWEESKIGTTESSCCERVCAVKALLNDAGHQVIKLWDINEQSSCKYPRKLQQNDWHTHSHRRGPLQAGETACK